MKTPRQKRQHAIALALRSASCSLQQCYLVFNQLDELTKLHRAHPEINDARISYLIEDIRLRKVTMQGDLRTIERMVHQLNVLTKCINDLHKAQENVLKKVNKNIPPHPLDSSLD